MQHPSIALGLLFLAPLAASNPQDTPWERFVDAWPGDLRPTLDPRTGVLARAVGRLSVSPGGLDPAGLPRAAEAVLERLAPVLGVSPETLVLTGSVSRSGLHALIYEQRAGDLPVLESHLGLRFSRAGDLLSVSASGLLAGPLDTTFLVSREDAGELARISLPEGGPWAFAWGPRKVVADDGRRAARPAWSVDVADPDLPGETWEVLVDARTGQVFSAERATLHDISGTVEGRGIAAKTQESSGPPTTLPMGGVKVSGVDLDALLAYLTSDTCENVQPVVSGDGTRVVFSIDCYGDLDLYTVLVDGTGLLKLTDNTADDYFLSPSVVSNVFKPSELSHLFVCSFENGVLINPFQFTFSVHEKMAHSLDHQLIHAMFVVKSRWEVVVEIKQVFPVDCIL